MRAFPSRIYVIASTMRTGSYLLCEALEATGVAGHPQEIFCPERKEKYMAEWQLPPDLTMHDFLRTALRKGTTANGVFGTKIHAHHLESMSRADGVDGEPWRVLEKIFPGAKYIHLRRRDHRGQAISYYRARITNEWWRIPGVEDLDLTGRQPQFNAAKIRELELELETHQRLWDDFFAVERPEVIEMEYENLEVNLRGEVTRVLSFLGLDPRAADELPSPRLLRQRDETTARWRQLMDAHFPITGADPAAAPQ